MKRSTAVVLFAAVLIVTELYAPLRNEFFVLMGNRDEAGGYYGFWSGLGGATIIFTGLYGSLAVQWRSVNCHTSGCWRIGKFPIAGGAYKVCRKCHGEITGLKDELTREVLKARHILHLESTKR